MSDDLRTSCIKHPINDSYITVHDWQLAACEDNQCAAALLSFLESWHNFKLKERLKARQRNDVARQHQDSSTADDSLWQFHKEEQLERGLKLFKKDTIRKAAKILESKGFVKLSDNPNPKYKFDRTRFFLFQPAVVNSWILEYESRATKNRPSINEKSSMDGGLNDDGTPKNQDSSITNNHTNNHTNSLRDSARKFSQQFVSYSKAMMQHQHETIGKTKADAGHARATYEMLNDYAQDMAILERTQLFIDCFTTMFTEIDAKFFSGWLYVQSKFPVWYAKKKPRLQVATNGNGHKLHAVESPLVPDAELLQKFLTAIKPCVNHTTFDTWFQPLQSASLEKGVLYISVPSPTFSEWITGNYSDILEEIAPQLSDDEITFKFIQGE